MTHCWRHSKVLAFLGLALFSLCGCRSYWVETTVENQTGQTIRELEVDYPSASFGINSLTPGASMHYHFKIQGSGPVKVQYLREDGKTINAQGLTLADGQQGQLTLRLLPAGKVDFLPDLKPAP
jgi:hypothetical protein